MTSRLARVLWLGAIVLALAAAVLVLARTAGPYVPALAAMEVSWPTLALASVMWVASFAVLASVWARSLAWWPRTAAGSASPGLPAVSALRIFFLSNLGRYLPGAIWQFAGLAALSAARGVSPIAATGGVLFQQLVLLLTGAAIALAASPAILMDWTTRLHPLALLAAILVTLALTVLLLPRILAHAGPWLERRFARRATLPTVSRRALTSYVAAAAMAWAGYGVAFWLLGRALLGAAGPSLWSAAAAWIGASVVGIAVVIAPGGLVVRELALAGALAPGIGLERATILAVASRVWLIAIEILGALVLLTPAGDPVSAERE